jgi:hypothetical protein
MSRFSLVLAASLVAVISLAGCAATVIEPSASPSAPASPAIPPTASPSGVTAPPATPTTSPVVSTPRPTTPPSAPPDLTAAEQHLLDGVQRGTDDCRPAGGSGELPQGALAGIECGSTDPAVARVGFYLFPNDDDMVSAYLSRMSAEGVTLDSGSCSEGNSEHAYVPDEGFAKDRAGCFVNAEGFANYRATLTGSHVYIGILGRTADMVVLETFAWKGSQDTPGSPTLWYEPR